MSVISDPGKSRFFFLLLLPKSKRLNFQGQRDPNKDRSDTKRTRMGWKDHRVTKKELCHSNETWRKYRPQDALMTVNALSQSLKKNVMVIWSHRTNQFTRVGWKIHRLTKKELCHSNETWRALNSTFPDTKCIVSFQINPHWISNSGLWKVVLSDISLTARKLMEGVLFHQDNGIFFILRIQKIVRWFQIKRIWRMINQFKAKVTHSSHCNHNRVCRSIVLVEQNSLRHFSRPFTKCLWYYFSKS